MYYTNGRINHGVSKMALEMNQMKVLRLQHRKQKKNKRNLTKERYNMFHLQ